MINILQLLSEQPREQNTHRYIHKPFLQVTKVTVEWVFASNKSHIQWLKLWILNCLDVKRDASSQVRLHGRQQYSGIHLIQLRWRLRDRKRPRSGYVNSFDFRRWNRKVHNLHTSRLGQRVSARRATSARQGHPERFGTSRFEGSVADFPKSFRGIQRSSPCHEKWQMLTERAKRDTFRRTSDKSVALQIPAKFCASQSHFPIEPALGFGTSNASTKFFILSIVPFASRPSFLLCQTCHRSGR
jgi:hypothetical protein